MFRQIPLNPSFRKRSQVARLDKEIPVIDRSSTTSLIPSKSLAPLSLGGLTFDVWDIIFTYLFPKELFQLAQVNSVFYDAVISSPTWRFYKTLFPTTRKVWAFSWQEAFDNYHARTAPPTGGERVTYNLTGGHLPQNTPFYALFLATNRRVIEFFGPSVRHRHDTFLTQPGNLGGYCRSWIIRSSPQYSMGEVIAIQHTLLELPPRGHHLRPAGLDVVGAFLFWVDFEDNPLGIQITPNGLVFDDEVGEMALWPNGVFGEPGDELSLLQRLFLSWGETRFEFSGQMCCAAPNVQEGGRKQNLRLFDYVKSTAYTIPFDELLKKEGPWLGNWNAPWLHPWGFDDDGNLLFKIIDTRIVDGVERLRVVQTSYHLETMRTTFSVEILEDIQLPSPWNFQLFSDQCWGYPCKDGEGNIWCILRDLRNGNVVRRVGPLNIPGTQPTDYACHISMFHVLFQDKSSRFNSRVSPAYTPLRIFSINHVQPDIRNLYRFSSGNDGQSRPLYELYPPFHPEPPGYWMFGGEDAAERYLFFQGSTINPEDAIFAEDWKKWVVWDSFRKEWTMLKCQRDWGSNGFYCLFSEIEGDKERVGLDWITME
jgi:hypothetical protein